MYDRSKCPARRLFASIRTVEAYAELPDSGAISTAVIALPLEGLHIAWLTQQPMNLRAICCENLFPARMQLGYLRCSTSALGRNVS